MASLLRSKRFSELGLLTLALLISVAVFRALTRPASDFSVFYGAWRLVLQGQGSLIYRVSTDRFLYAPGFAWLFSPLGCLPKELALVLWCLAKAFVVGFIIKKWVKKWGYQFKGEETRIGLGLAAWGVVILSRPILIDFEYGQVNLFILGACVWALLGHFEKTTSSFWDSVRWGALTVAAVAKLFPLPLLIVPWAVTRGISQKKLTLERRVVVISVVAMLLIPAVSVGWKGALDLLFQWKEALLARGLPLETHNQSFTALLHHYLSGNPTPVHSEGGGPIWLGDKILSMEQIRLISLAWSFIGMGGVLGWILAGSNHAPMKWIAVVVGALILPSHLVWKPYFVLGLPLAIEVLYLAFIRLDSGARPGINPGSSFKKRLARAQPFIWGLGIVALFIGINLTGYDFVGHHWASHFEAGSVLLVMHLVMLGIVLSNTP